MLKLLPGARQKSQTDLALSNFPVWLRLRDVSLLCSLFALALASCSHSPSPRSSEFSERLKEHKALIELHSKRTESYSGFQNLYHASAVLLKPEINEARLKLDEALQGWNETKQMEKLQELKLDEAKVTRVFLSFFTPDRRQSRLDRPKSLWKFALRIGDQSYPAKVKAVTGMNSEIQGAYPNHSRWSLPYILEFDVPLSQALGSKPVLLGMSTLHQFELELGE